MLSSWKLPKTRNVYANRWPQNEKKKLVACIDGSRHIDMIKALGVNIAFRYVSTHNVQPVRISLLEFSNSRLCKQLEGMLSRGIANAKALETEATHNNEWSGAERPSR